MYRFSAADNGAKALLHVWGLDRVTTDKPRSFGGAEISFTDGSLIRVVEAQPLPPALPPGRKVEEFLVEFLCHDEQSTSYEEYGISRSVSIFCIPEADGWVPPVDYLSLSTRAAGFDAIEEEIAFLDGCVGNVVEKLKPDFLVSSKNGRYQPTQEEVRAGFPKHIIPLVGYFPSTLVRNHAFSFWESVIESIENPSRGYEAEDPDEDQPWVRRYPDTSFIYRLASNKAAQDPKLVGLLSSELGLAPLPMG